MATFTYYEDLADGSFKNYGAIHTSESELMANLPAGKAALVFKDQLPWKYFDGFGAAYTIVPE